MRGVEGMKGNVLFTSESVTEGHPDKLCDQISDAVVDRFLQKDPFANVIAECAVSTAIVFMAARFSARENVDFQKIARRVISQCGYDQVTFNARTCSILTSIMELHVEEYPCRDERALSNEEIDRITVKNQATVFGFACNHTPALMPLPIWIAHKLAKRLTLARKEKLLSYLTPDGKIQVGVEYRDSRPERIHSITVIASQDKTPQLGGPDLKKLTDEIHQTVINPVFQDEEIAPDDNTRIFINPDGLFIIGGPSLHSGLTGRKGGVDTYGEYARQSGAALSGKGPLRIDRVGAYAARYAAKNVVAAGLADACEVQLSYTIGLARPVSIKVETFGTGTLSNDEIAVRINRHCDFRIAGIIKQFNLRFLPSMYKDGFYKKLAAYGHVGRTDMDLPWEKTDKIEALSGG